MPSCREVDPLLTPYIDGEVSADQRALVDAHLSACPPCRQRAEAETAARDTLRSRICQPCASEHLRARCLKAAGPRYSLSSLSLGAAFVVILGGVLLYGLTRFSPAVLAAQLTLDHVKCFALHGANEPPDVRSTEDQVARDFGWRLPQTPAGLQLIGVRHCFCGEGPAVHVMYRHQGLPVSLYVLRNVNRAPASTGAFGHDAIIWSKQGTTYVLLGRESTAVLDELAADLNQGL